MKKLIALIIAILLWATTAYAVTTNNDGPGDILGNGKSDAQAHKIFRLVRYVPASGSGDSVSLTNESIVIWDTTSDDGVTVTTTTTSGDIRVAGVIHGTVMTPESLGNTAAVDAGSRNWTWLQTYGCTEVNWQPAGGIAVSANSHFGTSASLGCANGFTQSATVNGIAGFAMDDIAGAAVAQQNEVFLKGLD